MEGLNIYLIKQTDKILQHAEINWKLHRSEVVIHDICPDIGGDGKDRTLMSTNWDIGAHHGKW